MGKSGYQSGDVRRLIGLSYKRVDYYDRHGIVHPEVKEAHGRGSRRLYSPSNMIELKVVKELLDRGISLLKIRRAIKVATRRYPHLKKPLHDLRLRTDGETIYAYEQQSGELVDLLNPDQPVLSDLVQNITVSLGSHLKESETHSLEALEVGGKTYLIETLEDHESDEVIIRCPDVLGVSAVGKTYEEALAQISRRIEEAVDLLSKME